MRDVFELAYRYVVPAFRGSLAKRLVEKGVSESKVATMLGLSRSAISRYVKAERGWIVKLANLEDAKRLIENLADEIVEENMDPTNVQERIIEATAYLMSRKLFCVFHKKIDPGIKVAECKICLTIFRSSDS